MLGWIVLIGLALVTFLGLRPGDAAAASPGGFLDFASHRPCLDGVDRMETPDGRLFRIGDPVGLRDRGGTYTPARSGKSRSYVVSPGATSQVRCFAAAPSSGRPVFVVIDWNPHPVGTIDDFNPPTRAFRSALLPTFVDLLPTN